MTLYLMITVLLMGLVTYLPRMLPFVFLQNLRLPPFLRRGLEFVPYAVISALLIPSVFSSTASLESAVIGVCAAVVLSLLEMNLFVVILASIAAVFFSEMFLL